MRDRGSRPLRWALLLRLSFVHGAAPAEQSNWTSSMRTWSWVSLTPGRKWPRGRQGRRLIRRLNRVGRHLQREVIVVSGQRNWREQHAAYMDYLNGGTLAAPCCSRHYVHSVKDCLRDCRSRHCQGLAADVVLASKNGAPQQNIGEDSAARRAMRRNGLSCPVPGEPWHVEVGTEWRA
jgi:hypothetical protein